MRTTTILFLSTLLVGCGSSSNRGTADALVTDGGAGGEAGAGGAAAEPVAVTCQQGDTRACLGPGACDGAQMCEADGAWSECDCGEPGTGGSGTGGGSGQSGEGGAAVLAGCEPGFSLCDGFCTDTRSAHDHCGGCGQACDSAREACVNSECECLPGHENCCADLREWLPDTPMNIEDGEEIEYNGVRYQSVGVHPYADAECTPSVPAEWCSDWFAFVAAC